MTPLAVKHQLGTFNLANIPALRLCYLQHDSWYTGSPAWNCIMSKVENSGHSEVLRWNMVVHENL